MTNGEIKCLAPTHAVHPGRIEIPLGWAAWGGGSAISQFITQPPWEGKHAVIFFAVKS
jgi:hypothetical protein